jgi:transmembrane sensor
VANIVEFGARTSIERQAREWLIRMDGDEPLNVSDREALREWMSRSGLHRQELIRISKFWSQANILAELSVCLESATQDRTGRRLRWVARVAVAACVVLASVILVQWNLQRLDGEVNGIYGTVMGEQKTVSLSDGSSVQLNTDSEVQITYSGGSRRVRLLRGEALFSVKPDPNRAFEVYAADSVVRAIGTAFAVHIDGSKVDVTVTKGVVDVIEASSAQMAEIRKPVEPTRSPPHRLGRLKAGEMTHFGTGADHIEVLRLAEPELQRRMAWREGYLAFSGEPLSEVIEQVNRYSSVTLEIGDPKLASIAIGGRFRIGDLDAILDALHTNFGIRARHVDEQNIKLESDPAH